MKKLYLTPVFLSAQVISPQRIPATVSPTLLMSPMVFAQPTPAPPKAAESGRLGSAEPGPGSLLLPLPAPEAAVPASASISKVQLQETLLHLIQVPCQEFSPLNPAAHLDTSTLWLLCLSKGKMK